MSYCHLTTSERTKIEVLKGLGYSCRAIARHLNRSHTTISREVKRLNEWSAEKAQWHAAAQKKKCGARSKFTAKLRNVIEEKLKATWSSEQIVGSLFQGKLSFKTIYRWLYSGKLRVTLQVLRQKGKRQAPRETRGRFNVGTSIQQRPKEVKTRETFGHWELDTVVSARGTKGCIATFAERKTRFYVGIQIPNRSAQSMKWAIEQLISRYPRPCFQTFTTDRGKEFSCYTELETQYEIPFYFADPYAPWQRGTNENSNGLLREFFPKRMDLGQLTASKIEKALSLINNRPRKCLNWNTTQDAFECEVVQLI